MSTALDEQLVRHFAAELVDAAHERVARRVLGWMLAQQLFGDVREREATYLQEALVAATFARLCSAAGVGDDELLRAGQFTAIFLYLDDTTELEVLLGEHPAINQWLGELEQLGAGTAALADFRASFADYRASLVEERRVDLATLTRDDYLKLRRRTIFVEPYLDCWRVLAGIDVAPDSPARAQQRRGQDFARELIILANDLGSLVRDTTSEHGEMNLIVRDAALLGSQDAAVDRAIAEYNALVMQLRELVQSTEPKLGRLLTRVVDGNIATMKLLTRRYAHSTALLDRLLPVAQPCGGG